MAGVEEVAQRDGCRRRRCAVRAGFPIEQPARGPVKPADLGQQADEPRVGRPARLREDAGQALRAGIFEPTTVAADRHAHLRLLGRYSEFIEETEQVRVRPPVVHDEPRVHPDRTTVRGRQGVRVRMPAESRVGLVQGHLRRSPQQVGGRQPGHSSAHYCYPAYSHPRVPSRRDGRSPAAIRSRQGFDGERRADGSNLDSWSLAAAATHRLDSWSLAAAATHRLDSRQMISPADELRPRVAVRSPAAGQDVRGVVLVLPGGRARSTAPASRRHLAYQRMRPFAAAVHAGLGSHGVAVWQLRYRVRGWNGDRRDPVQDARWAIERASAHHRGAPVFVLGHSMGGRTALYVAGDDGVLGACALAPWIEPDDPIAQLAGRLVVIAHGDGDRMTDPRRSRAYAMAAAVAGARVADFTVVGDRHAMLRRAADWHALGLCGGRPRLRLRHAVDGRGVP